MKRESELLIEKYLERGEEQNEEEGEMAPKKFGRREK